jgi:hypothetical protein
MLDKKFTSELKSIIHYITEYGIKNVSYKMDSLNSLKSENQKVEFISKVHLGFMKAQNLILQNLLLLGDKRIKVKNHIKELRRQEESKNTIQKYEIQLETIMYKEKLLRKTADSIAWQLLGYDITVIRRLYKHIAPVEIFNSNLNHDIKVVEGIFKRDNTVFPLINDITSFIQIGDLLVREYSNNKIGLLELKEGKVNDEIERIIEEHMEFNCDRKLYYELSERDKKFNKQFERYIKQKSKAMNTIGLINTGEGKDDVTGLDIKIIDDVFYTQHFEGVLSTMLNEVDKKNYSIRRIEDCLIIGVYNTSKIPIHQAFNAWKESMDIDFPTISLMSFVNDPVAFPLFLHPFSIDDKVKLINREKTILMSLDIKKWFEMLEKKNLKVNLLTKKETARLNTVPGHSKSFEYNGHAIEIQYKDIKQILHGGIFERMFNQFVRPSSICDFIKYGLSEVVDKD